MKRRDNPSALKRHPRNGKIGHQDYPVVLQTATVSENRFALTWKAGWMLLVAFAIVTISQMLVTRGLLVSMINGNATGFGLLLTWLNLGSLAGVVVLLSLLVRWPVEKFLHLIIVISGILYILAGINPQVIGLSPWFLGLHGAISGMGSAGISPLLVAILPTAARGTGVGVMRSLGITASWLARPVTSLAAGTAIGFFAIWFLMGAGSLLAAWLVYRSNKTPG